MAKKHRDDEVTKQIRVGRDALDEALRENAAATKRVQSSVPPSAGETEPCDEAESNESEEAKRETTP